MTETIEADFDRLFTSAAAGDEVAFWQIVAAFDNEMFRVCIVVARDRTVAEDAIQSTWSIAWRKLGTVRQPKRLRPRFVSIAVNETKKLRNKCSRRSEVEVLTEPS